MGATEMVASIRSSRRRDTNTDDPVVSGPTLIAEAALVRKIDWRIVPTLFLAYFLQFLDKVAINVGCPKFLLVQDTADQSSTQYANVMGLQKDLHMRGQDFAWTATAFFIGYFVAQWPQGKDMAPI